MVMPAQRREVTFARDPALLRHSGNPPRRLRELVSGRELILAPGLYDALSARLVEAAGFGAVYMSGFGATASLLGRLKLVRPRSGC
jgi:hypothetical protein